jgi:hypothetical protein
VRRADNAAAVGLLVVASVAAFHVHRTVPWIPPGYVLALITLPFAAWWLARRTSWPGTWRFSGAAVVVVAVVALLPVPWMKMNLDRPPGTAWRLDGRLVINGVTADPPGSWYWLTAGRPPIVAEVVRSWIFSDDRAPANMHNGPRAHRPAIAEPAAAAVGLRRAGRRVEMGVTVEVTHPKAAHLPDHAVVAMLNGRELVSRTVWERAVDALDDRNTITTADGARYEFAGAVIPFSRVDVIDTAPNDLHVTVGGRLAQTLPGSWFRDLALGRSHGLMVALVSYVFASGDDLATGRAIAGTGTIRADGTVGPIGGLRSKATAARHVGADVLLYPAAQRAHLDGFRPGSMRLCAVDTLDDAIAALATRGDTARSPVSSARPASNQCS